MSFLPIGFRIHPIGPIIDCAIATQKRSGTPRSHGKGNVSVLGCYWLRNREGGLELFPLKVNMPPSSLLRALHALEKSQSLIHAQTPLSPRKSIQSSREKQRKVFFACGLAISVSNGRRGPLLNSKVTKRSTRGQRDSTEVRVPFDVCNPQKQVCHQNQYFGTLLPDIALSPGLASGEGQQPLARLFFLQTGGFLRQYINRLRARPKSLTLSPFFFTQFTSPLPPSSAGWLTPDTRSAYALPSAKNFPQRCLSKPCALLNYMFFHATLRNIASFRIRLSTVLFSFLATPPKDRPLLSTSSCYPEQRGACFYFFTTFPRTSGASFDKRVVHL